MYRPLTHTHTHTHSYFILSQSALPWQRHIEPFPSPLTAQSVSPTLLSSRLLLLSLSSLSLSLFLSVKHGHVFIILCQYS